MDKYISLSAVLFLGTAMLAAFLAPLYLLIHGGLVACVVAIFGRLIWRHQHDPIGPFLTWAGDPRSTISIRWISASATPHTVVVAPRASQPARREISSFEPTTRHVANFDGLHPGTRYFYEIWEGSTRQFAGNRFTFTTAPAHPQPFSFAAVGDIQANDPVSIVQAHVLKQVRKRRPAFFLTMGDNVHNWDNAWAWRVFFSLIRRLCQQVPFFTTPGNHDKGTPAGDAMAKQYLLCPGGTWHYAFRYGNALLISLLSWDEDQLTPQVAWFEDLLQHKDPAVDWVIVFWHVPWWGPPYDPRRPEDPWERRLKEVWNPIFERHNIDLVLAGHKHGYAREGGKIITAAMHGVRKYPEKREEHSVILNRHHFVDVKIDEKRLEVWAIAWTGRVIDHLHLEKALK